jgi:single-stranded-DNA-specific exonuclease
MSFIGKHWILRNEEENLSIIEKLLKNRNLTDHTSREAFFNYELSNAHNPFQLKDMKKAVERLQKAIQMKEKIMIFGDYDVDGVSATVLLYDLFKRIGANFAFTLPDREKDGYGLKKHFIHDFKEQSVDLIITVDCGTANLDEIQLANELGMEVIVTDHHDIPAELPKAYALINPKQPECLYPNKDLSGSAVAYKLVCALTPYYMTAETNNYLYRQLGIAALGLVSDCMKLTGENRILTYHGLKSLESGLHPGVNALLEEAGALGKPITSTTIGFLIGPRINAAGRLDKPHHALELLLGNTAKVDTLSQLNSKRQKVVEQFVNEAKEQFLKRGKIPNIIVVSSPDWNVGALGLIASKISETYHRPAIAMQEREGEWTASCRSLNDFDITAFLRKEAGELFINCGGHMLAGGFAIKPENVSELLRRIEENSGNYIDPDIFYGALDLECEINPSELTFETCHQISKLEPFGNGNPEPTLLLKNVQIESVREVGKNKEHLQFPIKCGDKRFKAIAFRFGEHLDKIKPESVYDIAFNLEINEWNGYKNLQMRVVDMKQSD